MNDQVNPVAVPKADFSKTATPKWLLIFVVYFFFCLINGTVIGLTPENEFLNGLAQVMFFWSPLAVCLTLGKLATNKRKKMIMVLALIPTLWFAVLPTVMSGAWSKLQKGYDPCVTLVGQKQEGVWKVCKYHFSPRGFGEPNDYETKEKPVGYGLKIVRKI